MESNFDLWLYHVGAGWWLEESKLTLKEASKSLTRCITNNKNAIAGAILPRGVPLGLFAKKMEINNGK